MKNKIIIVCAGVLAILNLSSAFAKDAPTSAEQLRGQFESALKAKDADAITALFNWEGVSAQIKTMMSGMIPGMSQQEIKAVKLAPLPTGYRLTNEMNGVRYYPNVAVVGLISVEYAKGSSMQLPYGSKGGAFYLAGTVEEKFATPATKEKPLTIMVLGTASGDEETFSGSYVYMKGGKEVKEDIRGKGSNSKSFWGDYIKSCTVSITSDKQDSIQLVIMEDNKRIFESKKVITKDPVVYERK